MLYEISIAIYLNMLIYPNGRWNMPEDVRKQEFFNNKHYLKMFYILTNVKFYIKENKIF